MGSSYSIPSCLPSTTICELTEAGLCHFLPCPMSLLLGGCGFWKTLRFFGNTHKEKTFSKNPSKACPMLPLLPLVSGRGAFCATSHHPCAMPLHRGSGTKPSDAQFSRPLLWKAVATLSLLFRGGGGEAHVVMWLWLSPPGTPGHRPEREPPGCWIRVVKGRSYRAFVGTLPTRPCWVTYGMLW